MMLSIDLPVFTQGLSVKVLLFPILFHIIQQTVVRLSWLSLCSALSFVADCVSCSSCLIRDDFLHTERLCTVGFCCILLTLWHHLPSKVVLMGFRWASLYYSPDSMLCVFRNKQDLFSEVIHEHRLLQQIEDYILFDILRRQIYLYLIHFKIEKWLIA